MFRLQNKLFKSTVKQYSGTTMTFDDVKYSAYFYYVLKIFSQDFVV